MHYILIKINMILFFLYDKKTFWQEYVETIKTVT